MLGDAFISARTTAARREKETATQIHLLIMIFPVLFHILYYISSAEYEGNTGNV